LNFFTLFFFPFIPHSFTLWYALNSWLQWLITSSYLLYTINFLWSLDLKDYYVFSREIIFVKISMDLIRFSDIKVEKYHLFHSKSWNGIVV
jgi:hypothetical protein